MCQYHAYATIVPSPSSSLSVYGFPSSNAIQGVTKSIRVKRKEKLTPQLLHPHPLQSPEQEEQLVHEHGAISMSDLVYLP